MTDEGEWIEWAKSGECPVHRDTMVEVMAIMPGETEPRQLFRRRAGISVWDNPAVTAYRVVPA